MHAEPGSQVEDRLAASHVSSQANRHFAYFNKWLKARNTRGAVATPAMTVVPLGSAASIAGPTIDGLATVQQNRPRCKFTVPAAGKYDFCSCCLPSLLTCYSLYAACLPAWQPGSPKCSQFDAAATR